MAKEFGWDFKFISKKFTLSQIQRYCEECAKLNNLERSKTVEGMFYAFAASSGGMKIDAFKRYLDGIVKSEEKIDGNKTVEEMKKQGLPIEDM